ncbi:hypothetical protein D3C76_416530 [compost metagenome]
MRCGLNGLDSVPSVSVISYISTISALVPSSLTLTFELGATNEPRNSTLPVASTKEAIVSDRYKNSLPVMEDALAEML